ncbi:unnamed protein product [Heterobilharzia americana]|nr:unnamed protein product [Heterobilharzia americana]
MPETARETLELAKKYKPHGVVAIDIAGDDSVLEKQPTPNEIIQTFQEAKKLGIHRTVHVGENSSAKSVYEAVTTLHAERIGHGYHVLDNDAVYESVRNSGVHFELCPSSSFVTGAVDVKDPKKHPIHRFTQDAVNFSINTDDPTLTERWDLDEANYCINELGLKSSHLYDAKCNAAKAAFLSDDERIYLLAHINTRIGNRTIKV